MSQQLTANQSLVFFNFPHWFPRHTPLCPESLVKYCVVMPPCHQEAILYLHSLYNVTTETHFLIILRLILQQKRVINIGFIFKKQKQFQ